MCTFSKTYFKYLYASTYNLNWWAFLQKELCHMLPLCKNLNAEIHSQVWHVPCKSLEKNFCYTSVFLLGYEVEGFSPYCERVFQFFFFFFKISGDLIIALTHSKALSSSTWQSLGETLCLLESWLESQIAWIWISDLPVPAITVAKLLNLSMALSCKKNHDLMVLNYGVGEDSWESLGLQEDPTSLS